ncbi:MAG: WG repeat-containing protein [Bryobacteraceae bacterium]
MPGRAATAAARSAWFFCVLLIGSSVSCRSPIVTAEKKLAGFEICSPLSDGRALVLDLKTRRYGYADRDGTVAIPPGFADAQPFSEGLAAVRVANWGPYGYIDPQGRVKIAPAYEAAFPFVQGLAVVTLNGKQGFVDKSGDVRIPALFDRVSPFSEGLAQIITEGLAGFVNDRGKAVMPPSYFKAGSFHGGLAPVCKREKCGFVDASGRTVIPFEYDDAGDFSSGFAPVRAGRLWGYIDKQGKWLAEPAFDQAHPFREDVALVGKRAASQPDRGYGGYTGPTTVFGYLDRRGQFLIEPSILRASSFSEGLARIQVPAGGLCSDCYATAYLRKDGALLPRVHSGGDAQGGTAVVTAQGVTGEAGFLIDREGNALVEFDRARLGDLMRWAASASRLRYGYIDRQGVTALPHAFLRAEPFSEGLGLVQGRDGKAFSRLHFIDRSGAAKLEVPRDASSAQPFSGGFSLLTFYRKSATRYAYMDKTGTIRIEGDYAEARPFSEGLAAVKTSPEHGRNNWGYLNTRGELAIPPSFHSAGPFLKGLARVSFLRENILSGGAIDQTGKVVAEAFYPDGEHRDDWETIRMYARGAGPDDLIPLWTREGFAYAARDGHIAIRDPRYVKGEVFSEGLAAVMVGSDGPFAVWGYIDRSGKLVIPAEFQEARSFSEGLARVRDETGRYGYIDRKGAWAIAPSFFEEAHDFRDGRALVRLNGFYGYLNPKGELAVRPKYSRAASFSEGLASTGVTQ